ncbi:MAG: hypothetical protein MUC83_11875, partial [Pirellula sp.]|nr:hypothetical protein [Pirellula sp.]
GTLIRNRANLSFELLTTSIDKSSRLTATPANSTVKKKSATQEGHCNSLSFQPVQKLARECFANAR